MSASTSSPSRYRYYVAFVADVGHFGTRVIETCRPLESLADVDQLTLRLRAHGLRNPLVLGFSLFADPD